MPSRMKRTTSETGGATTDAARRADAPTLGARGRSPDRRPASSRAEQRLLSYLRLLRSSAQARSADDAGVQAILESVARTLELDALAIHTASSGDRSSALTLETTSGFFAHVRAAVDSIVAELERSGSRTLVLESLAQNRDGRAAVFRELGFASAFVGTLVADGRRGAVVVATRTKRRFGTAELTLIETVALNLTASQERRELTRRRDNAHNGKREFLTVLAHELRNPLAPLRNALEIIRTNDRARSPVEHSAYAMIDRQLQQIGRLADDLLDANQVVLGHVELAKQRVLLNDVVDRAAEQSRPWIEAARHTLAVELPREAIALDADAKRLARALSNLLNNAARRMDRGGRIVMTAEVAGGTVSVVVRARGRTVPGEGVGEVFADGAARSELTGGGPSQGGFTAGMTLVEHLVEMHGGTVRARTAADGVAEFEVRLPTAPGAVAAPREVHHGQRDVAQKSPVPHRILIADDNADSAESMGMLLRLMGNDVRIASDGLEAVEQAAAFQPDIVLMDIGMPRLDGYEAARRIRNEEWGRDALLVAVTGWGPTDDAEEAAAAGFDHHFTKPLDPAELRRLVDGVRPH